MSGSDATGRGANYLIDLLLLLVKLVVSGGVWLMVTKWRITFPLHVILALVFIALVINSPMVPNTGMGGLTAVLIVAMLASLIVALVWRAAAFRENRLFGYVSAGVGSAWVLATRFAALDVQTLFQLLAGMFILFGIMWWIDHRNNSMIKLSDEMRSFHENPERQKRAGVKDLEITHHEETDYGWLRRLEWPGNANSIDGVIGATRGLEAEWGELENTVTIERIPDPGGSGRFLSTAAEARCIRHDPLAVAVNWDGKPVVDITEWVQIGTYADGRPLMFRLWEDGVGGFHCLAAGAPRSGKSVLLQLWAAMYGPNPMVRSLFVDLKRGAAFMPLSPIGTWLAMDVDEALMLLELLNVECERRGVIVNRKGWDNGVWQPSIENPIILAYFDEMASLLGEGVPMEKRKRAIYLSSEIGRKGPGLGVLMRVGTQEPTTKALGGTQFMNTLQWRAVFRLNVAKRTHFVLPNLADQIEPANIRESMRGTAYVDTGATRRAMEVRMRNAPTWMLRRTADNYWHEVAQGTPLPLPEFNSRALPSGVQIEWDKFEAALGAFDARTVFTPESARNQEPPPEDRPERPADRGEDAKVINMPRGDRKTRFDAVDWDRSTPEIENPHTGFLPPDHYVAQAEKHPKNSAQARAFLLEALQSMLWSEVGETGLRRGYLARECGRSASWTSAALAELEKAGKAHRVGPKDNAYWFPGPGAEDAEPDEAEDTDETDEDDEDPEL